MLVYLGLGSNLGDREKNLFKAVSYLKDFIISPLISKIYETDPVDYLDQGPFLNMVLSGETNLDPFELLLKINKIESRLGRIRNIPKGPRTIDIDILLYNNKIINTEKLVIPHPQIKNRKFVLVPMLELANDLIDPLSLEPYSSYLENLEEQGIYYYQVKSYNL